MFTRTSSSALLSRVLLTALSVILVACGSQPPASRQEAYTTGQNPIQSAQAILARADTAAPPLRDRLLVEAAGFFAEGGRDADAERALREVDTGALETADLATYTLTYTRIALASERYLLARSLLGNPRLAAGLDALAPEQRRNLYRLRGDLQALLGDDLASAGEYARLATLLDSPADVQRVHDGLWQRLTQVPEQNLRQAAATTSDPILAGWLQLALTGAASQGDIAHQLDLVEAWQRANPRHPAATTLPASLRQAAAARGDLPARIALLLPYEGDMAAAARPLQDGIFAAYYAAMAGGATPPALRLYDTAGGDIDALY
ncbi:MAG: penicillin-binding protein activator, partial [Bacteroidales bacterium]|nr:penicillin-binding protein activator [Bacteroidales bacterium]